MTRGYSVDPASFDFAEFWLRDKPVALQWKLAQAVQDCVEDFMRDLEEQDAIAERLGQLDFDRREASDDQPSLVVPAAGEAA